MKNCLFGLLILLSFSCSKNDDDQMSCTGNTEDVKINQIQHIGTHNSYRKKTYEPILDALSGINLSDALDPKSWDYNHLPLDEQLSDFGMRSFELDIYYDPNGGQFYNRGGLRLADEEEASMIPALQEPGFKLLHVPDLDYETNYITFKDALVAIKKWSDEHPNHIPVYIMIEPKEDSVRDYVDLDFLAWAIPFNKNALDSLDKEIKDVFGANLEQIITPDDLRKDYETINAAILDDGWPTLKEARGKVFFVMMGSDDIKNDYLDGYPSLSGRPMFLFSTPGNPEAAFIKRDDPVGGEAEIKELVNQGYMIRTRADADTEEARTGDYSRFEAAKRSGAQMISTDYYQADERADTSSEWSNYVVKFDKEELAVFNPINGPTGIDCLIKE